MDGGDCENGCKSFPNILAERPIPRPRGTEDNLGLVTPLAPPAQCRPQSPPH